MYVDMEGFDMRYFSFSLLQGSAAAAAAPCDALVISRRPRGRVGVFLVRCDRHRFPCRRSDSTPLFNSPIQFAVYFTSLFYNGNVLCMKGQCRYMRLDGASGVDSHTAQRSYT